MLLRFSEPFVRTLFPGLDERKRDTNNQPKLARFRTMRTLIYVTMLIIAVAALAYATLPWWVPHLTIAMLEREGAEHVVVVVSHPDLHALEIERFEFELNGLQVGLADARLEYQPRGLLNGRLELFRAARLTIRQLSSAASDEPTGIDTGFAIPPPSLLWDYIPTDRIELDSVEIRLEAPSVHVVGQFGLNAEEISYRFVNIADGDLEGLALAGHIERVGAVAVTVTLPNSPAARVSIEGRIAASGAADLIGTVHLTATEFELLDPLLNVSTDTARLDADFEVHYYAPDDAPDHSPDEAPPRVSAEGSFTLDWKGDLPLRADLSTRGNFSYRADQWSVALSEATAVTIGLLDEPSLEVQLSNPTHLVISYGGDRLSIRGGLELAVSEASVAGTIVGFEGGWLDIDPAVIEASRVSFNGRLSGITRLGARRIPGLFDVTGSFEDEQISGTITLAAPGTTVKLPIRLSHHLERGTGQAQAVGDIAVDAPLLASILPGWGESPGEVFDLVSGRLDLQGAADWQTRPAFEVDATLSVGLADLGGIAAANPFRHATGTIALVYRNGNWHAHSDDLRVGELDVGIPVSDLHLSFSANEDLLDVSALRGRTLGGAFHTSPFHYAIDPGNTAFNLHISKLSLVEVLALEGEDITGSGLLSGIIPVTLTNNLLSVTQGRLESEPPGGVIRYAGAAAAVAAAQQPGLDFALRALDDFNYQTLSATVDYAEDGTLSVAVSLVGNNPAVEHGRTIHYNLNVTENLPVLLRSLRLSDELSQGIQNKLNR